MESVASPERAGVADTAASTAQAAPRHLIVTTPKSEMATAAQEAETCKQGAAAGMHPGSYFRRFRTTPKGLVPGQSRIYYVEDGFIRGYGIISQIERGEDKTCDTTGREYSNAGDPAGCFIVYDADSWTWVNPQAKGGFQGWRYHTPQRQELRLGGWLDPKPPVLDEECTCGCHGDQPALHFVACCHPCRICGQRIVAARHATHLIFCARARAKKETNHAPSGRLTHRTAAIGL